MQIHPLDKEDQVRILDIIDQQFPGKAAEKPVGSFGPLPMRSGYDKLMYGTGAAYFTGFMAGGAYGTVRGLQIAQGSSFNIRLNSVLNTTTMGWALLDNLFESVRGTGDYYNHLGAAFLSGFVFKSTAGIKPALITGSLMSVVVGVFGVNEFVTRKVSDEKKNLTEVQIQPVRM